ncbi:putative polygalacturonase [Canna indica]|uniref:Polygalacturonase n=1 Tax=Canna indica TaxID=4628 RepID=A0AAQ3KXA9_9LILI|nr:putative polygalacturonase [Canna indica]
MKRRLAIVVLLFTVLTNATGGIGGSDGYCNNNRSLKPRPHSVTITEFGAVGDGVTSNTLAFQNAVFYLRSFADKGGAQLYVPKGNWLTGSFNLTSHLTLFLEKDAVIIGSQDSSQWTIVEPLPSYGQGEDLPGGRHRSLINGHNLTDVVITGNNGIIDGQGLIWWEWFNSQTLNYSRPHLLELVSSSDIFISNLTFLNSPAWSIHPVYCSEIEIQNITVRASFDSPFTNGIVPDSCSNLCIQDCSINTGHDAIALKSGWDNYGISFGAPSTNIHIRNVQLQTPLGSALAFGSEMSGGISFIYAEDLRITNSSTGVSFKTTIGRGGFIKDIVISDVEMWNVQEAFRFTGNCSRHPDDHYDPEATPVIKRVTLKNIIGTNISTAGFFLGIDNDPFTDICLANITLSITSDPSVCWSCSNVSGYSESVIPTPCSDLTSNSSLFCFSLDEFSNLAEA